MQVYGDESEALLSCFGELDYLFANADSLDSLWGELAAPAPVSQGSTGAATNSQHFSGPAASSYLADLLSDKQDSLPLLLDNDSSSSHGGGTLLVPDFGTVPCLPTLPLLEQPPHRLSIDTNASGNSASNSGTGFATTTGPTTSFLGGALYSPAFVQSTTHLPSSNSWHQQHQQQQQQQQPQQQQPQQPQQPCGFRLGDAEPLLKLESSGLAQQRPGASSLSWPPIHAQQAAGDAYQQHSMSVSPGSAALAQFDTSSLSQDPSSNGQASHGSGGSAGAPTTTTAAPTVKRRRGRSSSGKVPAALGPKAQLEQLQAVVNEKFALIEKLQREKQALLNTTSVLELIIQCRNQQVTRLQSGDPLQAPPGCPPGPIPCDPASMKTYSQMSAQQLMATFKPILSEMSTALLNAENSTDPAAGLKLQGVMANFLFVVQHISLYNPEILKTVSMTLNGEQLQASETHWMGVALSLNLSPKQLADAQTLFNLYSRWLGRIHRERMELSAQLAKAMQMPRYGVVYNERHVGGQEMDHLDDVALLGALQTSVTRERCIVLLAAEVFNTRLLNYTQWARAVVSSYPWILDSPAIMEAAAKVAASNKAIGIMQL